MKLEVNVFVYHTVLLCNYADSAREHVYVFWFMFLSITRFLHCCATVLIPPENMVFPKVAVCICFFEVPELMFFWRNENTTMRM